MDDDSPAPEDSSTIAKTKDIFDDRIPDKGPDTGKKVTHKLNIPQAGEHDDNEEFQYYLDFLGEKFHQAALYSGLIDMLSRRILVSVQDAAGLPLWNAEVSSAGQKILTYQDGEAILYPAAAKKNSLKVTVRYKDFQTNLTLQGGIPDRLEVKLPLQRPRTQEPRLDIVFVMDTTGSMGDEIAMLQDTLYSINSRIQKLPVKNIRLRFGMVLYRDQGDEYVTRSYALHGDLEKFQNYLFEAQASGGGDYPEDLWSGMEQTLKLNWDPDAMKLVFVVTDAPARSGEFKRMEKILTESSRQKIKVFSIGASGLDNTGEGELRMLSQATKGRFIFLTYGETGESEGTGTEDDKGKVSHHTGSNYESRSLDDIVVDNVKREILTQADPDVITAVKNDYTFADSKDLIYRRVDNAMQQIKKQLGSLTGSNQTVMVLPPRPEADSLQELSEHIAGISEQILLQDKFLKVVDRSNMDAIMKELQLNMSGVTVTSEIRQLTQVDTILAGRLYFVGTTSVLMLRLISVSTTEVIAAAMVKI